MSIIILSSTEVNTCYHIRPLSLLADKISFPMSYALVKPADVDRPLFVLTGLEWGGTKNLLTSGRS